jgi:hypothetical protein
MQSECESPLVVAMEGDADRSRVRSGRRRSPPQFRHFSQPAQLLWVAEALAAAAPGHVAHVRSLVIDLLSPERLRTLGRDAERILSRIDTSAIN